MNWFACFCRFFGERWFTLVYHHCRSSSTSRRKSFGFGAAQHWHFQGHYSKIGWIQSKHHTIGCLESGWYFNICCVEIERLAKESCHWFGHQFGFITLPFPDEPTFEHRTNLMPWLDHWRTRWLKRWVLHHDFITSTLLTKSPISIKWHFLYRKCVRFAFNS